MVAQIFCSITNDENITANGNIEVQWLHFLTLKRHSSKEMLAQLNISPAIAKTFLLTFCRLRNHNQDEDYLLFGCDKLINTDSR